jgi:hypothetical protein
MVGPRVWCVAVNGREAVSDRQIALGVYAHGFKSLRQSGETDPSVEHYRLAQGISRNSTSVYPYFHLYPPTCTCDLAQADMIVSHFSLFTCVDLWE